MAPSKGAISGGEIVNDGVLIAANDETIIIYPISGEPQYSIRFRVDIDRSGEITAPTASLTNEHGPLITITRSWYEGAPSANTDFLIGETTTDYFYMNSTVTLIGNIDRHAIELRYVILRKAKL